jgi:hypothetical protein
MNDLRSELERARAGAPPITVDLDDVYRRLDRKEGRRRVGALVVALGICAVLVIGLLSVVRGQPGHRDTAAFGGPSGPRLSLSNGEYVYTRLNCVIRGHSDEGTLSCPDVQTWWALDGSGREIVGSQDSTFGAGEFPTDTGDLSYLSLDAATLDQQLRDRTAPDGASPEPYAEFTPGPGQEGHVTAGLVRAIGELLWDPNATPELKAALFQVLAGLQGMHVVQQTNDLVGRPANELWIETEEQMHHWWFDPQTEQLLASGDLYADGTSWLWIVERSGVTDSTTSTDLSRSFVPKTDAVPAPLTS